MDKKIMIQGLPLSTAVDHPVIVDLCQKYPELKEFFAKGWIMGMCIWRGVQIHVFDIAPEYKVKRLAEDLAKEGVMVMVEKSFREG